ncbi:MAG: hypothetical protein AAGD05_17300, partial [Bacteroidota bacterium]
MKNLLSFLLLCYVHSLAAQINTGGSQPIHPCHQLGIERIPLVHPPHQSSTFHQTPGIESGANLAADEICQGTWSDGQASRTKMESNAWWAIQLDQVYQLAELVLYYPGDIYPNGLSNYYVLWSEYPFPNTNLANTLAHPKVNSIFVETAWPSGSAIPLDFRSGQYLRIQLADKDYLALIEVEPYGNNFNEICGNGVDDDCDGLIDCEDSDCAPSIFNIDVSDGPSCTDPAICSNGRLFIQAANANGNNLSYSIDGGLSFSDDPMFNNLGQGEYAIVIINQETGCLIDTVAQLLAP